MNFMNKLERKFHGRGIHNLTLYIIGCYIIGYAIALVPGLSPIREYLTLEPAAILSGQVWRLVTWILTPPSSLSIFTIIMLFFYYQLGTTLEQNWGTFRYTLYILSGLIFTVVGAFVVYFIYYLGGTTVVGIGYIVSTYYVSMSIFLAFAASYPDMQVMLYMIFPIKIKWLAYLDVAMLVYSCITSIRRDDWVTVVLIIASLLNFILFFFGTRNMNRYNPREVKRRRTYQKAVSRGQAQNITKHRCAICGQTEEDNPNLEFRFCSKCNGNYEYCQNHLFTHKHIQ